MFLYFYLKVKNYIRHGEGTLYNPDREILYSGHWQNDLFHGHGQLSFEKSSYIYRGGFNQGRCHGHGIIEYLGQRYYQGTFNYNNFFYELYDENEDHQPIEEEVAWRQSFNGYFAFEGPIKYKRKDKSHLLLNMTYHDRELEVLELNILNIVYDENTIRRIGAWLKTYLSSETLHLLLKYNSLLQVINTPII